MKDLSSSDSGKSHLRKNLSGFDERFRFLFESFAPNLGQAHTRVEEEEELEREAQAEDDRPSSVAIKLEMFVKQHVLDDERFVDPHRDVCDDEETDRAATNHFFFLLSRLGVPLHGVDDEQGLSEALNCFEKSRACFNNRHEFDVVFVSWLARLRTA